MKNPGIKIPYLSVDMPLPEGTRCVEVRIPDDDAFMPVLGGLIAIATKWFNYDRDPEHKATQLAGLWRVAYLATEWEGCMNCEELTECLAPLLAELQANILEGVNNFNEYGVQEPGLPLTGEEYSQNLAEGTNPTCDYDIVWAQCLAIVQFTNRLITDLFEQIESKTNVIELAQLFNSVPFVRYVTNAIGEEAAVDLIAYYQEALAEGYLAEYTETIEHEIACQLFCIARLDCTISVDLLDSVFSDRVASIVPDTPGDLIELLALLAGISVSASDVVNLMFWFAWKGAALSQFFISDAFSGTFSLQTLLNLAVDNASNDWEILCTECPEIVFLTPIVYATADGWVTPPNGYDLISLGDGYWELNGSANGAGYLAAVEDSLGGDFNIDNITFPDGLNSGTILYRVGTDTIAPGGTPTLIEGANAFAAGMSAPVANPRVRFRFFGYA